MQTNINVLYTKLYNKYNKDCRICLTNKDDGIHIELNRKDTIKFILNNVTYNYVKLTVVYNDMYFIKNKITISSFEKLLKISIRDKLTYEYIENLEDEHWNDKLNISGIRLADNTALKIVVIITSLAVGIFSIIWIAAGIRVCSSHSHLYSANPNKIASDIIPFPMFIVMLLSALIGITDVIRNKYITILCRVNGIVCSAFFILASEMLVLGISDKVTKNESLVPGMALFTVFFLPALLMVYTKRLEYKKALEQNTVVLVRVPKELDLDTTKYILDCIYKKASDINVIMAVDLNKHVDTSATDSKVFGMPYWHIKEKNVLENMIKSSTSCIMIAQINLSDLHMGEGIIQIFDIVKDIKTGKIHNTSETFKLVYHSSVDSGDTIDNASINYSDSQDLHGRAMSGLKINFREELNVYSKHNADANKLTKAVIAETGKQVDPAMNYNYLYMNFINRIGLEYVGQAKSNRSHIECSGDYVELFSIDATIISDALSEDCPYLPSVVLSIRISPDNLKDKKFEECYIEHLEDYSWR